MYSELFILSFLHKSLQCLVYPNGVKIAIFFKNHKNRLGAGSLASRHPLPLAVEGSALIPSLPGL